MLNSVKLKLYYASKEAMSQDRRNQVKKWLASARKNWASVYRVAHGSFTAKELVDQISSRLEGDFEILMVHSAYDRLLPMYSGKAQELVRELVHFCGPNRTLAMPAFVLGGSSGDPLKYYRTRKFDALRTPSEMGLLTEIFRRTPGARRSLHPSHSVCALGPLAEVITSSHHLASTPSGQHTPFEAMARKQTVIIGLGIEYYRSLTQIHTAEHLMGEEFPVRFQREHLPVNLVDATGKGSVYDLTVFRSENTFNARVLRSLLSHSELQEWRYRGTPLFMTSAERVTNCLIAAARKGITVYGPQSKVESS